MNGALLLSVLVDGRPEGPLPVRRAGCRAMAERAATAPGRHRRSSVATATYGNHPGSTRLRVFPGCWGVAPDPSHASFSARVAGGPVRGRLGLTGRVCIAQPIEDSEARLTRSEEPRVGK